jgi:hypothetical protein
MGEAWVVKQVLAKPWVAVAPPAGVEHEQCLTTAAYRQGGVSISHE